MPIFEATLSIIEDSVLWRLFRARNSRHAFGTHAAMLGVNPWKLMLWMGHKRIDETMLYVHFAEAHMRPVPETILAAGRGNDDPDRRIIAMLSARQNAALNDTRCSKIAVNEGPGQESRVISVT